MACFKGFYTVDSDFSGMEGTNCYCSEESAAAIRKAVLDMPLHAVHLIGTGDYHYVSLFWAERVGEPFNLLLYDNHPDDQPDAFGAGMISCGSWVKDVRSLEMCKGTVWVDGSGKTHGIGKDLPLYISIDLDILSRDYARTDWDQGDVSLDRLMESLSRMCAGSRILGVDICGGITIQKGASTEDLAINAGTVKALSDFFSRISRQEITL